MPECDKTGLELIGSSSTQCNSTFSRHYTLLNSHFPLSFLPSKILCWSGVLRFTGDTIAALKIAIELLTLTSLIAIVCAIRLLFRL
jgi:hypothetical protein